MDENNDISDILKVVLTMWVKEHFDKKHWMLNEDRAPWYGIKFTWDWLGAEVFCFISEQKCPPCGPDVRPC